MIQFQAVSKKFRSRQAVREVSFGVARGEIFGLLGHNGAGKSTTFGMALGHVHADSGRITVNGHTASSLLQLPAKERAQLAETLLAENADLVVEVWKSEALARYGRVCIGTSSVREADVVMDDSRRLSE